MTPHRSLVSACLSAVIGTAALRLYPFPGHDPVLGLIAWHTPHLHEALHWTYTTLLFTTPYILTSVLFSLLYIFISPTRRPIGRSRLPPYPPPKDRDSLFVILGERHHPTREERVEHPTWLMIPERGLYTGIVVVGAVGSGKTSACMYPIANQLFGYQASDPTRRIGGLVLEVKGDFCAAVQGILQQHGRAEDYVEISLGGRYRYNPLHGEDLDAYALAYGINSLMLNLYGKGDDPFWPSAQTNLLKFLILLHQVVDGYVTLWDLYVSAIDPDRIKQKLADGERLLRISETIRIRSGDVVRVNNVHTIKWTTDLATGDYDTPRNEEAERALKDLGIAYEVRANHDQHRGHDPNDPAFKRRRERLESVQRWFEHDWTRIEPKLRTSIVEGVSVFLSLFDDPAVKYTFCPPKECYDPVANASGRHGIPLPPFAELIESGRVCAVNFPINDNPGLARAVLTLTKQDFQSAVLGRITRMAKDPTRYWRQVALIGDECHAFITAGEDNPTGDEKFSALQRQARCVSVLATQSLSSVRSVLPGETWRTWLQTMRTKVFLTLSDDFSAKIARDLCGREGHLKPHYSVSENGQDARVSMLTGRAGAHRASVSATKTYQPHRECVFEPKVFTELRNAHAIVLAYDGTDPQPAQRCYLKPHYLDPNVSYFDQAEPQPLQRQSRTPKAHSPKPEASLTPDAAANT